MFSVIIPLFNKADYIEKAIESVLSQTMPDFELIVIDDGSTDSSLERIGRFTDTRLQIIHQANAGVSTARNNGAAFSRFDYVAFLDADDWWDERFLEEMKPLVTQFPDAGLHGSNYYVVKNGHNTPAQIGLPFGFSKGYIDYFTVYAKTFWVPINCSFVVVKKSIFSQQNGFNSKLKFGEDFDLWVRIALLHKVAYLNRFLAYSNQDADTANRALGMDKCWEPAEHVTFNLAHLAENEKTQPVIKNLLDGLRVRSLIPYRLNGWYPNDVRTIISHVELNNQPSYYRFVYQWPLPVVKAYFRIRQLGSWLKQRLLRAYAKPTSIT